MKKIVLSAFGGPEVLTVGDAPEPEPPVDGWVVDVRAIGVNYAELVERRGRYRKDQRLPYELGKEACGVVAARGPEAPDRSAGGFDVGDRAIVIRWDGGCYAERVTARPGQALRVPRHLSFEEGAAFANTFATAWWAQEEIARARPGDAALIQAAAGGVGTAAVALARARGLDPILGTAGGRAKCARVEALGADRCFDYTAADFRDGVREATRGRGVDYVLESVGGEVYERSLEVLAPGGRLIVIGFSSIRSSYAEAIPRLHPLTLFHRSIAVGGLNVQNLDYPRETAVWDALVGCAVEHELRPVIGLELPLGEAARAHAEIEARRTVGKVVLKP